MKRLVTLSVVNLFVVMAMALCVSAQTSSSVEQQAAPDLTALLARLQTTPSDREAFDAARYAGFDLIRRGRFAEAAEVFERLSHVVPTDQKNLYGYALALFNLRRVDDAEKIALQVVNISAAPAQTADQLSVKADALVLLGVIRAVRRDNTGALRYTKQAVSLAPENFDARLALGRAYYGAGDPANAAASFRDAINLNPRDTRSRFFLATALEQAGDVAGALAAYRELLQVAPESAEGYSGIGILLLKRDGADPGEGIRALTRAIEINGDLYEARVALGRALIRAGRAAEAVTHLRRAAELAANNPEPHYQLAIAYRRLGKKTEADEESRIVKRLHEARRGVKETSSVQKPD